MVVRRHLSCLFNTSTWRDDFCGKYSCFSHFRPFERHGDVMGIWRYRSSYLEISPACLLLRQAKGLGIYRRKMPWREIESVTDHFSWGGITAVPNACAQVVSLDDPARVQQLFHEHPANHKWIILLTMKGTNLCEGINLTNNVDHAGLPTLHPEIALSTLIHMYHTNGKAFAPTRESITQVIDDPRAMQCLMCGIPLVESISRHNLCSTDFDRLSLPDKDSLLNTERELFDTGFDRGIKVFLFVLFASIAWIIVTAYAFHSLPSVTGLVLVFISITLGALIYTSIRIHKKRTAQMKVELKARRVKVVQKYLSLQEKQISSLSAEKGLALGEMLLWYKTEKITVRIYHSWNESRGLCITFTVLIMILGVYMTSMSWSNPQSLDTVIIMLAVIGGPLLVCFLLLLYSERKELNAKLRLYPIEQGQTSFSYEQEWMLTDHRWIQNNYPAYRDTRSIPLGSIQVYCEGIVGRTHETPGYFVVQLFLNSSFEQKKPDAEFHSKSSYRDDKLMKYLKRLIPATSVPDSPLGRDFVVHSRALTKARV